MYHPFRKRFQSLVTFPSSAFPDHDNESFYLPGDSLITCPLRLPATMALQQMDPRLYSTYFESTASAPSLRASEQGLLRTFGAIPGATSAASTGHDQDSSSVKVVVRVRQFVQRGKLYLLRMNGDANECREGQKRTLHCENGP
jgi:hypothetical protein